MAKPKLKLDWDAPASDGGSPVTQYLIQVNTDRDNDTNLLDGTNFGHVVRRRGTEGVRPPDVHLRRQDCEHGQKRSRYLFRYRAGPPLTSTGEKLQGAYARWFRVMPLNKKSNTPPAAATAGWMVSTGTGLPTLGAGMLYQASVDTALAVRGVTGSSMAPGAPIGLVAETAKNVHSLLTTQKGVLLTWDKPGHWHGHVIRDPAPG